MKGRLSISYAILSYVVESRRRIGMSDRGGQRRHWRQLGRCVVTTHLRLRIHSQVSYLSITGARIYTLDYWLMTYTAYETLQMLCRE